MAADAMSGGLKGAFSGDGLREPGTDNAPREEKSAEHPDGNASNGALALCLRDTADIPTAG